MVSYITFTTDFDASPGVMKGVIWRIVPSVQIADLSYTIRPQDVRQAALTLARQGSYFPENTIHMAVVDPGVGTAVNGRATDRLHPSIGDQVEVIRQT
jgi:S-adenosylmethionine hydrolase